MSMMSVSALNTKIGSLLEATFVHVMVEGEVAQVTYHRSGHVYFSIKDDTSTLSCVMWRSTAARMKFRLEQGEHIVIDGSISVYVPRGTYQLMATHIEPYGKGTLAVAFEQLKTELKAKGYFDAERKKPLPHFPTHIALVTAAGGAALQDMLAVAEKRWPSVAITVADVLVQGEAAAGEIARGIAYTDALGADLIITGRGGGSLEDLWAFNERIVAEAIHESTTPVVSAVGHEVDTLISDFVADLRAPTPSAAMEMVLPDRNELRIHLDEMAGRMEQQQRQRLRQIEERCAALSEQFVRHSPLHHLQRTAERFQNLREDFGRTMAYRLDRFTTALDPLAGLLKETETRVLHHHQERLDLLAYQLSLQTPDTRTRAGFGELVYDGVRTPLSHLNVGDTFEIVSPPIKMRVKALDKIEISSPQV